MMKALPYAGKRDRFAERFLVRTPHEKPRVCATRMAATATFVGHAIIVQISQEICKTSLISSRPPSHICICISGRKNPQQKIDGNPSRPGEEDQAPSSALEVQQQKAGFIGKVGKWLGAYWDLVPKDAMAPRLERLQKFVDMQCKFPVHVQMQSLHDKTCLQS